MVVNTQHFLHTSVREGKNILLEGAQGFALDIDHGTYPYVTSSNPTIGGALIGTGLNASNINQVIGIMKAYVTRVGEGPFPTEARGEDGDRMRSTAPSSDLPPGGRGVAGGLMFNCLNRHLSLTD